MSRITLPLRAPFTLRTAPLSAWAGALVLFLLGGVAGLDLITALLLWIGPTDSALGRFASDFRVWCFYADPRTGSMNWVFPLSFFAESLLMAGLILWVGLESLVSTWKRNWAWRISPLFLSVVVSLTSLYALTFYSPSLAQGTEINAPEFPARDLRVSIPVPDFSLIDQSRKPVTNADLNGKITILTAFYAHCFSACPAILGQIRRVAESLPADQRAHLQVVGVTMDPEKDEPAALAEAVSTHKLDSLNCRLVTGDPSAVNGFLDRLGVERKRDPATGIIDHPGLLFVIDAKGRIVYRFAVGETQERWMVEALRILLTPARSPGRA